MVPTLSPQVLTGIVLLLLLYLSCTTNQRGIPFGYLLYLLVQGHQHPVLCSLESLQFLPGDHNSDNSGVFIPEEVDGAQAKGSGYETTVDAEHFWRPPCLRDLPQLPKYHSFPSISFGLKEFYCMLLPKDDIKK